MSCGELQHQNHRFPNFHPSHTYERLRIQTKTFCHETPELPQKGAEPEPVFTTVRPQSLPPVLDCSGLAAAVPGYHFLKTVCPQAGTL